MALRLSEVVKTIDLACAIVSQSIRMKITQSLALEVKPLG